MTTLAAVTLILHVLLGVAGVMTSYVSWRELLRKTPRWGWLQKSSSATVWLWMAAWLTAGYYYVTYYGTAVKPIIKAGQYPWAHSIMMEAKEHVFLLLPFLAIVIWAGVHYGNTQLVEDNALRRGYIWLSGTTWILSLIIVMAGIFISGAVQ